MRQWGPLSPEYLAAIVHSSADAILANDLDGIITYCNAKAVAVYRQPREKIVGRHLLSLVPDENKSAQASAHDRVAKGQSVLNFDSARLRKTGEKFDVSLTLSPIFNPEGEVVGISEAAREIEDKKAQLRFWDVIEAAPVAMVVVDGAGNITLINKRTEELFGYMRSELLGGSIEVLLPSQARAQHEHFRAAYMSSPQARPMGMGRELQARRKDGSQFPVEVGLTSAPTVEGTFAVASIIDISARKREERLREMEGIERLSAFPSTMVTAKLYSSASLRESVPVEFHKILEEYDEQLRLATEQRVYKVEYRCSDALQALGDRLGFLRAGPRDVVEIHSMAMGRIDKETPEKAAVFLEEGRLAVLELMGYLVSYYRHYYPNSRPMGAS